MKPYKVHTPGESCEVMKSTGKLCTNRATYKMVRIDGSSQIVCRWCAKKLRVMADKYPDNFNALRFAALSPKDQLTKY